MERATKTVSTRSVPGLEARTTDGRTTYRLRYRIGRRQRSITLKHAASLADAREWARGVLRRVERGDDPQAKPATTLTVLGAAARWVRARRRSWKPRTTRETLGLLRRHVLPEFGESDVNTLTRAEVWKSLRQIAAKHPVTGNRAYAVWRALFAWLLDIDQEHLGATADPLAGLKKRKPGGKEKPRDRTYNTDELRRILATGDGLAAFILHTGVRESEARLMLWGEVDMEARTWTIPGARSKNGRAHVVPLSAGALKVLRSQDRTRFTGGRVFPYARQTKHLWATAERAGLARNVGSDKEPKWEGSCLRYHDLRRTVGDRLRQQWGEATMHAALGHADKRLTETYGPSPRLAALADALQWWSDELERVAAPVKKEA